MNVRRRTGALAVVVAAAAGFGLVMPSVGQITSPQGSTSPRPNFTLPTGGFNTPSTPDLPPAKPITSNGVVVEDVVARINDQVITRTEYQRAEEGLVQQAKQENWSPADLADKQHTLLRDMIDQQLLLSKGKELGISADAEVTRQLDDIRKRANLPDMESLQKAAAQQGISFEDFKQNIRNQVITQQVVRDEVGRHLNMTPSQEQTYYDQHKQDFSQPEQVHLSEILVPTPENATDAQITEAQTKANAVEAKLKAGATFADEAKAASGGPTASAGGDLGDFKRGMLGDVLEKATFDLPVGGYTEPIRTRQGFVILKVDSHQQAGTPPMQQVEGQIQEGLYMSLLQPALRNYLSQARQDAYLEVMPGFTDVGSTGKESRTTFSAYAPPPLKKKIVKKQRAEQEKAEKAERDLAAAREKVAAKQQAKAAVQGGAPAGGARNVSYKPKKIKREKVRFGQAPRNSLPNGSAESVAAVPSLGSSAEGNDTKQQAPGAAIAAATDSMTTITTGTGVEQANPLDREREDTGGRKTRFSSRQTETEEKKAEGTLAKAEVKASKRPQKATAQETAEEKVQAAPLGLQAAPQAKPKKEKRAKDQPKARLQDKQEVAKPATPAVAPTVNPSLGTSPTGNPTQPVAGTADQTTLPPANTAPAGALPAGQPIPAVTGTQPNAPATTVPQPQ